MPSFTSLWHHHPTIQGDAPLLDKKVYANQCAINMSASLMRAGVNMNTFTGTRSWQKDQPKYPVRAQELADWLVLHGATLGARLVKFRSKDALEKIDGKSGIVFFQNYWGLGNQGDHIDLWNGTRLTDWRTWARIHVRLGNFGLHNLGAGSDFKKAESVWFWEL
jgi:hypothetical protein